MRWYEVTLGIQGFAKEIDGFAQPKSKVELLINKHETHVVPSSSSHRQNSYCFVIFLHQQKSSAF